MKSMVKKAVQHLFMELGFKIQRVQPPITRSQPVVTASQDFQQILDGLGSSPVKLHFGCGPRVLKGWVNIDLAFEPFEEYLKGYTDKYYGPSVRGNQSDFIVWDITEQPLPLPNDSVDVVFHEDFLEHLSQRGQVVFLAEILRVLKPGGIHRVNTPDLISSMNERSDFALGFNGVYIQEWDKHNHLSVLTDSTLKELALMIGYSTVDFNGRDQSCAADLLPLEYRPGGNSRPENGNIFADLIK